MTSCEQEEQCHEEHPFIISELICYLHEEDVSYSACSFLSWVWLCHSLYGLVQDPGKFELLAFNNLPQFYNQEHTELDSLALCLENAEKHICKSIYVAFCSMQRKIKLKTFELCAVACRAVDGVCSGVKNSLGWSIMLCWNIFNSSYTSCPLTWSESWLFWNSHLVWKEECEKNAASPPTCKKEFTLSYFGCSLWQHLEEWLVFTFVLS